jgi:hypothetical protein
MAIGLLLYWWKTPMTMREPIGTAHVSAPSFRTAAESIRERLNGAGLTIFAESDWTGSGKILYVACPFLLLEALAFDRSSAVFLPVQVTVLATKNGAAVHWINPAALLTIRLPAGARRPIAALCARISQALAGDSEPPR